MNDTDHTVPEVEAAIDSFDLCRAPSPAIGDATAGIGVAFPRRN